MASGRQDQYSVTCTIANRRIEEVWDKMTGGEFDSEETKYRSGAMGNQISLGGPTMTGNVTLSRLFDRTRDAQGLLHWLFSQVGKGTAVVTKTPLDRDGNAFGQPLVYQGTLKTVTPGDVDSNSSDADVYDIVISTEGQPG
jgi:hypothetical protein